MAEYIEREAFLADKKWLYCTDCDKRKGKKRGKMVTLYEIGEAPCKSCGIHDMLEEVEVYPAADVREVKRGVWCPQPSDFEDCTVFVCSNCGHMVLISSDREELPYCGNCGADMREKS